MRKGIGPRGLGAVKSPAKQTKHDGSMKYQKHLENQIRNQYGSQLRAKENEIRNRTYAEAGFEISPDANVRNSKEYQRTKGKLDARVMNRYMGNKGPQELRAKRDAALAESRAAYDAMPQVQSRRQYQEAKQTYLDTQKEKSKRAKK